MSNLKKKFEYNDLSFLITRISMSQSSQEFNGSIPFWAHCGLFLIINYFLFQTIQCVVKYMQGPTYISSAIVAQKEAEFPAMTVCPESRKYKLDVLQQHGIPTVHDYNGPCQTPSQIRNSSTCQFIRFMGSSMIK